jgi:DNA-binding transcriptional regulator YdaS (Cro superfamily)
MDALEQAKQSVGGATKLARLLTEAGQPITSQAVGQWDQVPVKRVFEVERITGVNRSKLRPDLWPTEVADQSQTAVRS